MLDEFGKWWAQQSDSVADRYFWHTAWGCRRTGSRKDSWLLPSQYSCKLSDSHCWPSTDIPKFYLNCVAGDHIPIFPMKSQCRSCVTSKLGVSLLALHSVFAATSACDFQSHPLHNPCITSCLVAIWLLVWPALFLSYSLSVVMFICWVAEHTCRSQRYKLCGGRYSNRVAAARKLRNRVVSAS